MPAALSLYNLAQQDVMLLAQGHSGWRFQIAIALMNKCSLQRLMATVAQALTPRASWHVDLRTCSCASLRSIVRFMAVAVLLMTGSRKSSRSVTDEARLSTGAHSSRTWRFRTSVFVTWKIRTWQICGAVYSETTSCSPSSPLGQTAATELLVRRNLLFPQVVNARPPQVSAL